MNLVINLLALVLVLGLSWAAMIGMGAWFHARARSARDEEHENLFRLAARGEGDPIDLSCRECSGSGACTNRGVLEPCGVCEGTGVR